MLTSRISLLLSLATVSALFDLRADQPHSAINPVPRPEQGWKDRAQQLDDRLKQTPDTELLFIGDSITQGWEGAGKAVWEKSYAAHKTVNLGIGGDRTQHVLWRLQNAPIAGIKPKAAVVMIGTNNSNGEDNTAEQIADGVTTIIRFLREKLPETKILLLGIFPRGENFNAQRGKLAQINQVLQKLDDGQKVFYLDIGHRFLTGKGLLPVDLMPDYLHLSPRGYEIWAEAIQPKLNEFLGGKGPVAANSDATGEWSGTFERPNDDPVQIPLTLKVSGSQLTGVVHIEEFRGVPIENGTVEGDKIKFTLHRQPPEGREQTYAVTGTIAGGEIKGSVMTTDKNGQPQTTKWSARKK